MDESTNGGGRDYWDVYPKHLGPPDIPNYGVSKVMKNTKTVYNVELDEGAFRSLWELVEADGRYRFPARDTMTTVAARLRAVEAFRRVWWHTHTLPTPPAPVVASGRSQKGRGGRLPARVAAASSAVATPPPRAQPAPPSGAPLRRVIRRKK